MTNQNNSIIICGDCDLYVSYLEDFHVGRCLAFDSVDPEKRDPYLGGVEEKSLCKYGVLTNQEIPLTEMGIAGIANNHPEDFFEKTITAEDINLSVVMRELT